MQQTNCLHVVKWAEKSDVSQKPLQNPCACKPVFLLLFCICGIPTYLPTDATYCTVIYCFALFRHFHFFLPFLDTFGCADNNWCFPLGAMLVLCVPHAPSSCPRCWAGESGCRAAGQPSGSAPKEGGRGSGVPAGAPQGRGHGSTCGVTGWHKTLLFSLSAFLAVEF